MSISWAPLPTALEASAALMGAVLYPLGKPITVQMGTRPAAYWAACFT